MSTNTLRNSGKSIAPNAAPVTNSNEGKRMKDVTPMEDIAPRLVKQHPELEGTLAVEYAHSADHNMSLSTYDIFRGEQHLGCIEDDGDGYVWYPGSSAKDSAIFDDEDTKWVYPNKEN